MSRYERPDLFSRFMDVLTLLVLAGGFYYAVDQAKKVGDNLVEAQRTNDLATWNSVAQQWLAMDQMFVQHPEFRDYIYSSKVVERSDQTYNEKLSVAAFVLDFIDYAVGSYANLPSENRHLKEMVHPEGWVAEFRLIFSRSALVCQLLFDNEEIYSPATRELGRTACPPELRTHTPPP
jgi:hypothetical protein